MSEIANYFLYRNAEGETGLSANSIDDLNLDDLFAEIDYCHSSIGRQYLYYLLLSDKTSGMEKQEALLSSLATHTGLRTLLSNTLKELDKPDAYSIVSILEMIIQELVPRRWLLLISAGFCLCCFWL